MDQDRRSQLASLIREFGWATTWNCGLHNPKKITYTVGLHESRLPELVIAQLPLEWAHQNFILVRLHLFSGRYKPIDGEVIPSDSDYPFVIRQIPASIPIETYALEVADFYRGEPVDTVQLVLCDRDGRYPWDPGCVETIRLGQSAITTFAPLSEPIAASA